MPGARAFQPRRKPTTCPNPACGKKGVSPNWRHVGRPPVRVRECRYCCTSISVDLDGTRTVHTPKNEASQ